MIDKPEATQVLSLELENFKLRGVQLSWNKGKPKLERIFEQTMESDNVKPLYINEASSPLSDLQTNHLTITTLSSSQVLVRSLEVKLKKEKDIDAVFAFQAEPLLPFPLEQGIIDKINAAKTPEGSQLTLFAAKKEHVQNHIKTWSALHIEPEVIASESTALTAFAKQFHASTEPFFAVHVGTHHTTCVLIKDGVPLASQACLMGASNLNEGNVDPLKMELTRILYALAKQIKGHEIKDILVTGDGMTQEISQNLFASLGKNIRIPEPNPSMALTSEQLQKYAIPLGAGLSCLPKSQTLINFRQQEHVYPHPWKRFKKPIAIYVALNVCLALAFYMFGQSYIGYKEDGIREQYVELLTSMNKSYKNFEAEYAAKNPSGASEGEIVAIKNLTQEDLLNRLELLQKELQSTPDLFPLLPNVPRVSDVLAWLSTHPNVVAKESENATVLPLIQLENFSYTMVKKPDQTKKQEKYQVKVDLEFSTATPKLAREFHDALIAPNEIVDPKGEVKWSSNRGKYRTSFFLKDKTVYPSARN